MCVGSKCVQSVLSERGLYEMVVSGGRIMFFLQAERYDMHGHKRGEVDATDVLSVVDAERVYEALGRSIQAARATAAEPRQTATWGCETARQIAAEMSAARRDVIAPKRIPLAKVPLAKAREIA